MCEWRDQKGGPGTKCNITTPGIRNRCSIRLLAAMQALALPYMYVLA